MIARRQLSWRFKSLWTVEPSWASSDNVLCPPDSLAVWYLGQTGILKDPIGLVMAIDLTFRLDRQRPVLIEPEDWDVDIFIAIHSHDDHADPEIIRGLDKNIKIEFVGSFGHYANLSTVRSFCVHDPDSSSRGTVTDLNHTGVLISFSNNLSAMPAAAIVKAIRPKVVVPRHYDMINNVGSPQMLRIALDALNSEAEFRRFRYHESSHVVEVFQAMTVGMNSVVFPLVYSIRDCKENW